MRSVACETLVERAEEYAEQHDDPTVAEVLGRFLIKPDGPESAEERALVKETLTSRADSDGRRERAGGTHA